ncbi:SulP family inorganic anion transporter [Paenibacillus rigui]|uniref:Sodium-independent anion transporter n=1 Tax=Paenibacillus rigui TaxID=554312 RepID=A0A229UG12_9BACL|nr:sulfate permease [Paenibacillus rigui]OXM82318.1 sodium-independent anion transporter [Paenibacillus rigui]
MKWWGRFEGYQASMLHRDLVSGFIVGIIAIPLGMAFAIASGVKPEYGIYTTIVAGILISLLGGSRFQIGGPTGAFIPIVLGVVVQYGYENLLIAGMLAGVILILMGVLRLGVLISYIPRPVTIGFTSGIAVIIFSGQISPFLGLSGLVRHEDFISNMREIGTHLATLNGWSIATALISLSALLIMPKVSSKIPGSLVGLVLSTVVAALWFNGNVATIGSVYGGIPSTLPHITLPNLSIDKVKELLQPALVIAILGGIESLLSAVVADGMTGSRHNSNKELIGQGIANLMTPLFGGIPATGAIARTATNIKNGAASPFSGMIHGVVVLLILLLCAPMASAIPLASMAPILMVVAWNMSERKEFIHILKMKTGDSIVLVITFLLTVFTDLTTAVEVGLLLAAILFIKRLGDHFTVFKVLPDPQLKHEKVKEYMVQDTHDCPQLSIFTMEGPLFFGSADRFKQRIMEVLSPEPRMILLRMGKMPFMDSTGASHLSDVIRHIQSTGGKVFISGIRSQPRAYLKKTGLDLSIGPDHFFDHTGEAIDHALKQLDYNKCLHCKHRAFRECSGLSNPLNQEESVSKLQVPYEADTVR